VFDDLIDYPVEENGSTRDLSMVLPTNSSVLFTSRTNRGIVKNGVSYEDLLRVQEQCGNSVEIFFSHQDNSEGNLLVNRLSQKC